MPNEKDQKQVFVSYSTQNTELAQFLCSQLEGSGVSCWIAPRDIPSGKSWANAIVDGLTETKVMVLLVSEASVSSDEVAKEIDLANGMKKIIFPVRIENVVLKGAALYHLSNKQWVDALDDDKLVRFKVTTEAVLQSLGKVSFRQNVKTGSTLDLFGSLIDELNQKHRQRLSTINTMFHGTQDDTGNIVISLPLNIGATGIVLRFYYDISAKEMRIYADAAYDGDPIKNPFVNYMNSHFQDLFGKIETIPRARRWSFVEIVPKTRLATRLTSILTERCFEHFRENMMIFSDKVLPKLFDWIEYSSKVISAINRLEETLREVFPEKEGWRVGAPEGERLNGCLCHGRINVFKDNWQPKDNYNGRGLLSITLESNEPFIDNLYIGILKYESWMTLKHREEQIASECERILGKSGPRDDAWVWWQSLDEEWKASGIVQGDFRWENKLDDFIQHSVEKIRQLKSLESLLGQTCNELPSMQKLDFNPNEDIPKEQLRWWESSLYVYNWMDRIAKTTQQNIRDKFGTDDIAVEFSYKGEWWTDIYLRFKVEKFDAAVRFRCGKNQMITKATNLEPPDFETEIIESFLKINNVTFTEIKVEKDFDDGIFLKWLERFEGYVIEQTIVIVPAILTLKKHLENVVGLTKQVESELNHVLTSDEGWVIDNMASSLERYDSITFWHKNWLREGAASHERPPLVMQITPELPCFDELTLVVKHLDRPIPEIERNLGAICGACDYAFGKGVNTNTEDLWKRPLDDPFRKTGGRQFDVPLLEGEQRNALITHLREVAEKVKQMKDIVGETCRAQNDVNCRNEVSQIIDNIISEVSSIFPKQEGWEYFGDAKGLSSYSGISFYKTAWKRDGLARKEGSILSFRLQCENNFDNLYIGIAKGSNLLKITPEKEQDICKKFAELLGKGKSEQWWISYQYLESAYRYSANYIQKKADFIAHVKDLFVRIKNLTPLVDDILSSESYSLER